MTNFIYADPVNLFLVFIYYIMLNIIWTLNESKINAIVKLCSAGWDWSYLIIVWLI